MGTISSLAFPWHNLLRWNARDGWDLPQQQSERKQHTREMTAPEMLQLLIPPPPCGTTAEQYFKGKGNLQERRGKTHLTTSPSGEFDKSGAPLKAAVLVGIYAAFHISVPGVHRVQVYVGAHSGSQGHRVRNLNIGTIWLQCHSNLHYEC